MNHAAKRFVLFGVGLVALVAVLYSLGVFSPGLPAANPAAASSSASTAPSSTATSAQPAPESPGLPERVTQLQQRLAENPRDVAALSELASFLYQSKRYAQAADMVYQALDIEPNNPKLRMALGQALFFQGMPAMAVAELHRAVELDPNSAEAHFNYALAVSHGPRMDLDAARVSWETVVRLDPDGELGRRAKEFIAQTAPGK